MKFFLKLTGESRASPGDEAVEEEVREGVHSRPPGVQLEGVTKSVRVEEVVLGVPGVPVLDVVEPAGVKVLGMRRLEVLGLGRGGLDR